MLIYIIVPALAITILLISFMRHKRISKEIEEKTKRFELILNRFKTNEELSTFMKSEEGSYMHQFFGETKWDASATLSLLYTLGIIMTVMSFGFLYITLNIDSDLIFGFVAMFSVGIGSLLGYQRLKNKS